MAENRTSSNDADVVHFLGSVDSKYTADALVLAELTERVTREPPKMGFEHRRFRRVQVSLRLGSRRRVVPCRVLAEKDETNLVHHVGLLKARRVDAEARKVQHGKVLSLHQGAFRGGPRGGSLKARSMGL